MRNFKKLLVVICVLALLSVGCVLAAFAADNSGTVDELNALNAAAEAETNPVAKYNAVLKAAEYLKTKSIFQGSAGYAEAVAKTHKLCVDGAAAILEITDVSGLTALNAYDYMMKADRLLDFFDLAEDVEGYAEVKVQYDSALARALGVLVAQCDANIETTLTTAHNAIAVNKANSLLKYCVPFGDASVLDAKKAELAELEAAQERAEQINYKALDASNRISNYDLPIFFTEDWEKCNVGLDSSYLTGRWHVDLKNISNKIGILQEENGNKTMVHRYLEKDAPAATYTQVGLRSHSVNNENGLVIEFDITTFGEIPQTGMFIETGSVDGAFFPPPYFAINSEGDICSNNKSTVVLDGAIVKGEWTHIVLVLEPSEFVYKLYVDGQFICQYDAKYEGKTRYDHGKVAFRISGQPSTYGEISIDNIQIYGGDSYRIHDKLEIMNDEEKFLYYVDYFTTETNLVNERSLAYTTANELIGKYWVVDANGEGTYTDLALSNSAIMDAVDKFVSFNLESFLYEVGMKNLDQYVTLAKALAAMARNTSTASERKAKIEEINKFVNTNVDLINRDADTDGNNKADFYEYEAIVTRISREATYDANSGDFVRHMDRFVKSSTLSAKQRNYAEAAELAENDGIDISLILDESNPDRANFMNLVEAYNIYRNAATEIYELTLSNNSNKIIKCVNKINVYTTEEEWLANREFMEEYLGLLKDIVLTVDEQGRLRYNPDVTGIDEAIEFFNASYSYFYAILQTEHVAHIKAALDRAAATDAYIEKMGIISTLEKYVEVEDIDEKDPRIADLLNDLDTCKAELVLREADYAKLLVQNAVYFINLVERMRTAETYNEQREYFEQAYVLYFNIDASVEGCKRAVEIFDEYKINLDRIEKSSLGFIEAVAIYNACETEDDKYAALVECYYNAQFVELSYDGAEEAMAEYLAAYEAYMNYAESVNEDITSTGNAVASLRVPCGITNVIAIIIKKLFGI